jgi:DNA-binding CsgD family transcriptional regulator
VLTWAAAGKTMVGIADILSISQRTVFFHLSNARRKLGAANSRHAICKALALGLIEVGASALRTTSDGGRERPGRR